jgi:hypothetical protein
LRKFLLRARRPQDSRQDAGGTKNRQDAGGTKVQQDAGTKVQQDAGGTKEVSH